MTEETLQKANDIKRELDDVRSSYDLVSNCTIPAGCCIHIPCDSDLQSSIAKVLLERVVKLELELSEL